MENDPNLPGSTLLKLGQSPVSLSYLSHAITSICDFLLEVTMDVYNKSHAVVYRTDQMVGQVNSTFEVLNGVNESALEANLISLNVIIEGALSGKGMQGSSQLAEEIKKLSEHSLKFSSDIRNEVTTAKSTIDEVKKVITRSALQELTNSIALKSSLERGLGEMQAYLALLDQSIQSEPQLNQFIEQQLQRVAQLIASQVADIEVRINMMLKKQKNSNCHYKLLPKVMQLCDEVKEISFCLNSNR